MSDSIRKITTQQSCDRIETGPLIVNDDWTGLFIRGDNCFAYRLALEAILTQREDRVDKLHLGTLNDLLELLVSTDHRTHVQPVEKQINKRIANLNNMTIEQIDREIFARREILPNLAGDLWPNILLNEIDVLTRKRIQLTDF